MDMLSVPTEDAFYKVSPDQVFKFQICGVLCKHPNVPFDVYVAKLLQANFVSIIWRKFSADLNQSTLSIAQSEQHFTLIGRTEIKLAYERVALKTPHIPKMK